MDVAWHLTKRVIRLSLLEAEGASSEVVPRVAASLGMAEEREQEQPGQAQEKEHNIHCSL